MAGEYQVYVADDDPIARQMLAAQFKSWGHKPQVFADGQSLWLALEANSDACLMILDWNMPGIDGIRVCELAKRRSEIFYSYIIMITGKDEDDASARAFEAGIDDLLSKPFDPFLLRSRVQIADRILRHEAELQVERRFWEMHANQMEELAQERAKQLVQADRMVTLGTMSAGIAHEVNNPASFISGNVQTLEMFWPEIKVSLEERLATLDGKEEEKLSFILQELPGLIEGVKKGVKRISKIVQGLKSYSHQKGSDKEQCDLKDLITQSLELTNSSLKNRVIVHQDIEETIPPLVLDRLRVEQVLVNLIVNAAQAMKNSENAELFLRARHQDKTVVIELEDTGPGIPEDALQKIWTPFFTTKEVGEGTGLGLHICSDIIQEHNGQIAASNVEGGGACFKITLPVT